MFECVDAGERFEWADTFFDIDGFVAPSFFGADPSEQPERGFAGLCVCLVVV